MSEQPKTEEEEKVVKGLLGLADFIEQQEKPVDTTDDQPTEPEGGEP